MRAILIGTVILMTGTAAADDRDEAIKKTAVRLTLAYQCAAITGDYGPYEWAKTDAARVHAEAGVTNPTIDQFIAEVEEQSTDGGLLNEKLCGNLLKNFRK